MTSIRIWHGCKVIASVDVSDTGYSTHGAVGGAENSSRADIELDPWANLIVDHRAEYPTPVSILETPINLDEDEPYEPWSPDDIPGSIVDYVNTWKSNTSTRDMLAELFHMYDAVRHQR